MRNREAEHKPFLKLTLLAAALVATLAVNARAQVDPGLKQLLETSAVGVVRGQVARLNVYYRDLLPPARAA